MGYQSIILQMEARGANTVKQQISVLNREMTNMNKVLKAIDTDMRKNGQSMELYESKLKGLNVQLKTAESRVEYYRAEIRKTKEEYTKAGANITELNKKLERQEAHLRSAEINVIQLRNALDATSDEMTEFARRADIAGDNVDQFGNEIKQADDNAKGFNTKMLGIGFALQELGSHLMNATRQMSNFALESYNIAKASQATATTVETAFGDMTESHLSWSGSVSKSMNVFEDDLLNTSAKLFSLGKSFGIVGEDANLFGGAIEGANMSSEDLMVKSQELTEIAYDLAAAYDTSVDQALGAVESAMKGNTEAIEDYGISVQASSLEQTALNLGVKKSTAQMTQAEKSYLTMIQILDKASVWQGRYTEEMEAGLNPMLELDTAMKNMKLTLGEALKPAVDGIIDVMVKVADAIGGADQEFFNIAITVGSVIGVLAVVASTLGTLALIATGLGTTLGTMFLPLVGAIAVVYPLISEFVSAMQEGKSVSEALKQALDNFPASIVAITTAVIACTVAYKAFKKSMQIKKIISNEVTEYSRLDGALAGVVKNFISAKGGLTGFKGVLAGMGGVLGGVQTAFMGLGTAIAGISLPVVAVTAGIIALVAALAFLIKKGMEPAIKSSRDYGDAVSESTATAVNAYRDMSEQQQQLLTDAYLTQAEITDEHVNKQIEANKRLQDTLIEQTNTQMNEELAILERQYKAGDGIIDETEQARIDSWRAFYETNLADHQASLDEQNAILQKANEENRALTTEENARLEQLQKEMNNVALSNLTDSQEELMALKENFINNSLALEAEEIERTLTQARTAYDTRIAELDKSKTEEITLLKRRMSQGEGLTKEQYDKELSEIKKRYSEQEAEAVAHYDETYRLAEESTGENLALFNKETGEIMSGWERTGVYLSGVWETIKTSTSEAWNNMLNSVSEFTAKLDTSINEWIDGVKTFFSEGWNWIVNSVRTAWQNMLENINTFISNIKTNISNFFGTIQQNFSDGWNRIKNIASDLVQKLNTTIVDKINEIKQSFIDWWEGIKSWFSGLSLVQIGRDIINSLKDGLASAWESVTTWFSDKVGGLFGGKKSIDLEVDGEDGGYSRWYPESENSPNPLYGGRTLPQVRNPFKQLETLASYTPEVRPTGYRSSRAITQANETPINSGYGQSVPLTATIENVINLDGKELQRFTERVSLNRMNREKQLYKRGRGVNA